MHPNPAFRPDSPDLPLRFARDRGFGCLTVNGAAGPLAAHVPFVVDPDPRPGDPAPAEAGPVWRLRSHLARSNPVLRALRDGPVPALVVVSGDDTYVSPDWYGIEGQVPTWNYVAVHLRGTLALADPAGLRAHLAELSARFEADLPGPDWTLDKLGEEAIVRLERMILPVEMEITAAEGTWKLAQNKPAPARTALAGALGELGTPGARGIAALMRADLARGGGAGSED